MRRVPIRVKLAAALAVPLIAMGLVTVIEVASVANEARDVRVQTNLATATIGPNGLITALQNERNFMAANVVGADEMLAMVVSGYEDTRAATDAAREQFTEELEHRGDAARTAYAPALDGLDDIDALRTEIDGLVTSTIPSLDNIDEVTVFFDQYTDLIEPFFGGMSRISIAMDDPELRQGAGLMEAVARQIETIPQLTNALVLPATVATAPGDLPGINRSSEIAEVAELQDSFRRQAETLRTANGAFADLAAEYYPEEFTTTIDDQATQGVATGTIDVVPFLASLDVPSLDQAYIGYQQELSAAIQDRADELNGEATSRQQRYGILMALTFAAAVVLTILVSLSITRPLRSLTRQAKEMADRRLPDAVADILDTPLGEDVQVPTVAPVRVVTRDEVADVADALNTVQDSALDLAVEQAVLRRNIADSFVNLGRRNQNLLGRQLDFITELESSEADPDTLASLFRLDHLATRMRRNAESLLVLAGIEPPRQWAAPVRLTDVIRAALGEVEDYQRVVVRGVEPATIIGSAAADLAHLLAELVENALVFSPPDRSVDVRGAAHSNRHSGGYTLAVIDAGLGMSAQDVASANRRLAGSESFTIAPSKYLGHYVAGNLAARHGIDVELQNSPGSGITALVELPASLLTPDGQAGAPQDHLPDRRAMAAPPAALAPRARALGAPPVAPTGPAGPAAPGVSGPDLGSRLAAAAGHTSGGLARRAPRDGTGHAGRAGAAPTDDQLASFARATGRSPASPPPVRPSAPPAAPGTSWPSPAAPAPAASGGPWPAGPLGVGPPRRADVPGSTARGGPAAGSPPPLARRERGAQMPTTAPISLRRTPAAAQPPTGPTPAAGPPPAGPARGPAPAPQPASRPMPAHPPRAATEVYGFLSSFSAGVQRGLDDLRAQGIRPPDA